MSGWAGLILALACLGGCHWLLPFGPPASDRGGDQPRPDTRDARSEREPAPAADQAVDRDGPGDAKKADIKIDLDAKKDDVTKADIKIDLDAKKGDVKKADIKIDLDAKVDTGAIIGCELTEQSNGLSPQALCSQPACTPYGGACSITGGYVTGSYARVGNTGYRLACGGTCNKQNAVRYARSTSWNLSPHTGIQFWININTATTDLDCGYSPWIILYDTNGSYRRITRSSTTSPPIINNSINQWLLVTAPLHTINADWYIINGSAFDPTKVKSIEIDLQPAGGGFTAYIDGLIVTGGSSPFNQCSP